MAKILIAGIGGGKKEKKGSYSIADYYIDSEENLYEDRTFITSALEEHYKIDKTVYIGTVGSMWDELYLHYAGEINSEDEDYIDELENTIIKATKESNISDINIEKFNEKFNGKVEAIVTKFGINEIEIFENFNLIMKIGEILNDGDEVYIDITHSFRSNAMWMFLIMNYVTDVLDKKIEIKKITYGMFEAGRNIPRENNRPKKRAPIIDLKVFYDLMKWIKGANEFKNYGNSYTLLEMINDDEVNKKIKTFSDGLNLNYLGTIKRNISSLKRIMDTINTIEGPGKLIIPNVVKDFINIFDNIEKEYEFLFKLAEWNFNQKRYAMTAININEGLREFVAEILEIDDRGSDFNSEKNKIIKYLKKLGRNEKYVKNITKGTYQKKEDKIYKIFEHTRKIRNEIAHSKGEKDTAINDVESLKGYIEFINSMIKDKNFIKYLKESCDID